MTQALTQEELIAYFEDALSPDSRAAIEERLLLDPQAQATLTEWSAQNEQLKALFPDMSDEPIPDNLTNTLRPAPRRRPLLAAAMVALFAVGLAGGWTGHALISPTPPPAQLAQAAISAHDTFVVEVTHPVEVPASDRAHMDSWMSKRIGRPMSPPDLNAAGFTLLGGRILPGVQSAAGLYMYENAEGQRITLYITQQDSQNSAFRFADQGQTQSLHWNDNGLGFALTGTLPRDTLKTMAKQAYDQLL